MQNEAPKKLHDQTKRTSLSLAAFSLVDGLPSASLTSVEALFELVSALTAAVVIADAAINEFGVVASVRAIVCANGMTSSSSSSSAMLSITSGLLSTIDTGVVRPLFGAESVRKVKIHTLLGRAEPKN